MTKDRRIQDISDLCRTLGADVRYDPRYQHLVVLAWEHKGEEQARFIQKQIQRQAAQHPELVCYCFDPFSTLIYAA